VKMRNAVLASVSWPGMATSSSHAMFWAPSGDGMEAFLVNVERFVCV
jgi:hypothetical protein